jgi:hypothetical protein
MHTNFSRKTRRKEQLGRPRRRWEDNIRMNLREIWRQGVCLIHVAQDRDQWRSGGVAGSCEHGNEPWGSIKGRNFVD